VPRVVRATDSTGLLVGAVGIENNNDRNFMDLRGMGRNGKLLKNSTRERKRILIAPLKRPRFFTVTESLSSWTFTRCLERNVGFRPKSRGPDGKLISPTWLSLDDSKSASAIVSACTTQRIATRLPWAHRTRLQQILLFLLTANVSNKSGNLLFAQSYPEQYENVRFVHTSCTARGICFVGLSIVNTRKKTV
jgi:hypothetical protein